MDIKELAKVGAIERLKELHDEVRRLQKAFPELVTTTQPRRSPAATKEPVIKQTTTSGAKKAVWSAARRRAQSLRMKAYWRQAR